MIIKPIRIIAQILVCFLLFCNNPVLVTASEDLKTTKKKEEQLKKKCLEDLHFFRENIITNAAPFKDPNDPFFKKWFDEGYLQTKQLIESIKDTDDCHYAIKYYVNGFRNSYISMKSYIPLAEQQYPGFLTAKYGNNHVIIYKDPNISYLKNINLGNYLTHINDIPINDYFNQYILPFYSNDNSKISTKIASIFTVIVNGNHYIPIPLTATVTNGKTKHKITLKYTELSSGALDVTKSIRQPPVNRNFKVEKISNGIWITIPSFYIAKKDRSPYINMLSKLKDYAKEDYIIFDLRGNMGGSSVWTRPIIRNLWGDDYIKHLGKKHDFNSLWVKKVRVSKQNFFDFKKTANALEIKKFATALKNKDIFFKKEWNIYKEDLNLYTNDNSAPFKAKIFVFTDHFCRSTCWLFVNQMRQIPEVTHIGLTTKIQTSSSYAKRIRSDNGNFDFFYPTELREFPNTNLGLSLIPSKIFNGDLLDDFDVMNWVLSILEYDNDNPVI